MKKVLVVALVLAVASLANATYTIQVNNTVVPAQGIAIVGNTATLQIYSTAGDAFVGPFALLVNNTNATLTGGVLGAASDTSFATIDGPLAGSAYAPFAPAGMNGVLGVSNAIALTSPGGKMFDSFNLTVLTGKFPVTVSLFSYDQDSGAFSASPVATALVTPEPMTMTLLGLGGLLFARKK